MAALTSSAVTPTAYWLEKGLGGKEIKVRQVTLVLTGQGDATNTIAASLFDLTEIHSASPLVKSDDSITVVASPSYDKTKLLLKAAGTNAPATYSGTFKTTIRGI